MDEMRKELAKIREDMATLANREDMTDEEVERLGNLKRSAMKLQVKIDAAEEVEAGRKAEAERIEREKQQAVRDAVAAAKAKFDAESRRLPFGEAPYQAKFSETWKYDNLNATDLSLVIDLGKRMGVDVGGGALKAMALRVAELKDDNTEESRKSVGYVKSAFKMATGIEPTLDMVGAAVKTDGDPNYSTLSQGGSDWVGTAYSASIWAAIRAGTEILNKVPSDTIPDGFSTKYWPLESTDPTWYKVAEAVAADSTLHVPAATTTSSKLATANKQITVGKIGARTVYTGEADEDSLIKFSTQLREQLQISGAEILEHICIDGDTEDCTSRNINAIDTQPGEAEVYFLANGFRKLALVTNTANSRSAGGALVIEDYIDTLKLMGTAGLSAADLRQCAFIVDPNVHFANMKLPEVKTRDVSSAATIESGFLKAAYGVPVMPSWMMHKASAKRMANAAGKVDADTDANNLYGAIVAVRWDQWKQAFKRRMSLETTRIANADAWEIVALMRWGLASRDNEASAITYYVGV